MSLQGLSLQGSNLIRIPSIGATASHSRRQKKKMTSDFFDRQLGILLAKGHSLCADKKQISSQAWAPAAEEAETGKSRGGGQATLQVLGQPRWHSQSLSKKPGQERWILFAIPALCSLRQEDHQRFKASLGYRDPVFKKEKEKKNPCTVPSVQTFQLSTATPYRRGRSTADFHQWFTSVPQPVVKVWHWTGQPAKIPAFWD